MRYRFESKGRSHIHLLARNDKDYEPLFGTTSIISEVFPPPLAWYGSAKALEPFGYISSRKEPDETKRRELLSEGLSKLDLLLEGDLRLDKYQEFLEDCYSNHDIYKKEKAREGKDKHAEIENYVRFCLDKNSGAPTTYFRESMPQFTEWAMREVDTFLWSEAYCFSERLWVGGQSDFGFKHKGGKVLIGDAKPRIYHKHFIQVGGYRTQIEENGLFDKEGNQLLKPLDIEGYCIYDYNTGLPWYLSREWTQKLSDDFAFAVEIYKRRELIGTNLLD